MLKMMQIFIMAGSNGIEVEDYCHPLCIHCDVLSKKLETVVHMEYAHASHQYLSGKDLTYKDICMFLAEDMYKNLKSSGSWPLAKHTQDSCAILESFVNTLVQTGSGGFQGKCHKCGKPGHFAKKCPNKKPAPVPPHGGVPILVVESLRQRLWMVLPSIGVAVACGGPCLMALQLTLVGKQCNPTRVT